MKTIYFSPEDLLWMRRRLLGSVQAFAALMLLVGFLQAPSPAPGQTDSQPATGLSDRSTPVSATPAAIATAAAPPRTTAGREQAAETAQGEQRPLNPVPPVGWRRTRNGWEHVSSWPTARPTIQELIVRQRAEEPAWVQGLFQQLRSIPPVGFALFQLTAVALIAAACEIKRPAA